MLVADKINVNGWSVSERKERMGDNFFYRAVSFVSLPKPTVRQAPSPKDIIFLTGALNTVSSSKIIVHEK